MEENKELNTELQEEVIEETTVETEEVVEEAPVETEDAAEEVLEATEEEVPEIEAPKGNTGLIVSILVVVISVVIVALSLISSMNVNKYNNMGYIDINGQTAQDMADAEGVSLEEFLAIYQLPADMPADTNSNAVENMIPTGVIADQMTKYMDSVKSFVGINENVSNFELFKVISGMPAEVKESTPIGEAKGMVKLKYIISNEEELAEFKEMYGFDESVTLETEYKDIQNVVDNYKKQKFEEQKAMEEQIMQQLQQMSEETTDAEVVPAE